MTTTRKSLDIWNPSYGDGIEEAYNFEFYNVITFNNYFAFDFKSNFLDGLSVSTLAYSVEEAKDPTMYSNWNFTTGEDWKEFIYDKNSSVLMRSEFFTIGSETLDTMLMYADHNIFITRAEFESMEFDANKVALSNYSSL